MESTRCLGHFSSIPPNHRIDALKSWAFQRLDPSAMQTISPSSSIAEGGSWSMNSIISWLIKS